MPDIINLNTVLVTSQRLAQLYEIMGLTTEQTQAEICGYIASLKDHEIDPSLKHVKQYKQPVLTFAPVGLDPVPVDVAAWLRPDWTPELFLQATPEWSDKDRQCAVLLTRDIPLISWYVNHRAGRPRAESVDAKRLESQAKIIKNEWDELLTSIEKRDGYQMRDDQADLFLVVGGLGAYYPANMNQDFVDMVRANFTRIDDNLADAELTQKKWSDLGLHCAVTPNPVAGTYPVLITQECEYKGDSYSVGKFLKSHKFTDAKYPTDDGATATIV